jgi:hypothetical protein
MRQGAPDCAAGKYARPALEATGGGTLGLASRDPGYPLPAFEAPGPAPVWVYERAREWLSMGLVREGAAHPRIPATAQRGAIDACAIASRMKAQAGSRR